MTPLSRKNVFDHTNYSINYILVFVIMYQIDLQWVCCTLLGLAMSKVVWNKYFLTWKSFFLHSISKYRKIGWKRQTRTKKKKIQQQQKRAQPNFSFARFQCVRWIWNETLHLFLFRVEGSLRLFVTDYVRAVEALSVFFETKVVGSAFAKRQPSASCESPEKIITLIKGKRNPVTRGRMALYNWQRKYGKSWKQRKWKVTDRTLLQKKGLALCPYASI